MLIHPQIDPIAVAIGPLAIRWYGLMYLIGFGMAFLLARSRIKQGRSGAISYAVFDDLFFFSVLGVVLGGRLGYVLFYKPGYYLSHPLEILAVWQGGMAFHGGFLGVLLAMVYIARKYQLRWLAIMDFIAPLVPPALAAGRIGNFINGELWGRVVGRGADVPWGMVFRGAGDLPRHPSQVYQFLGEGLMLFVLLWLFARKDRKQGQVSAVFLLGYGLFRFMAEYFREPDAHLGILSLGMSMGQWLCLPMILGGIGLWFWSRSKRK